MILVKTNHPYLRVRRHISIDEGLEKVHDVDQVGGGVTAASVVLFIGVGIHDDDVQHQQSLEGYVHAQWLP
jgi:hypothetical protein